MGQVVEIKTRRRRRPIAKNGKVPPRRKTNRTVRSREYLTPDEVKRLIAWAELYNREWLIERHGFRPPAEARRACCERREKLAA